MSWTPDTLRVHLLAVMDERDRLYTERVATNDALREKLADHDRRFELLQGQKSGAKDVWGYIVGAVGILMAILMAALAVLALWVGS